MKQMRPRLPDGSRGRFAWVWAGGTSAGCGDERKRVPSGDGGKRVPSGHNAEGVSDPQSSTETSAAHGSGLYDE